MYTVTLAIAQSHLLISGRIGKEIFLAVLPLLGSDATTAEGSDTGYHQGRHQQPGSVRIHSIWTCSLHWSSKLHRQNALESRGTKEDTGRVPGLKHPKALQAVGYFQRPRLHVPGPMP